MSGAQSSESEAGPAGAEEQRCTHELEVGLVWSASEGGSKGTVGGAGGSQNQRKAVVQKESADTQEYARCQLNDIEVDIDEDTDELSFVPSAVSRSNRWHEPKFMCDRQCRKEGCKYYDIASVTVEDDGKPHTMKPSRSEEIARPVAGWFGCKWSRELDHGDLRGKEEVSLG